MKKFIKLITAFTLAGMSFASAQYNPAMMPETVFSPITPAPPPISKYNVGTDTRAGFHIYPNYFNVTVSDFGVFNGSKQMFWENSGIGIPSGSVMLPQDTYDPDVVLVETDDPMFPVKALIVYYGIGTNRYYLAVSDFDIIGGFLPIGPVITLDNRLSGTPYINIDADDHGNFAIVYQYSNTVIRTACATVSTIATVTSTIMSHAPYIEPDIAVGNDGTMATAKIAALDPARVTYTVIDLDVPSGAPGGAVTIPAGSGLGHPRIACPDKGSINEYAVTMMRNSNEILLEIAPYSGGTPTVLNDGSYGGLTDISGVPNSYPAITYHYTSSPPFPELVSVGWHTEYLPGDPSQMSTMVDLNIESTSFPAFTSLTTPGFYEDVSISTTGMDYYAEIALSGRYTHWAKTAAFAHATSSGSPSELVWKYQYSSAPHWRPTDIYTINNADNLNIYPNITSDRLNIKVNTPNYSGDYDYSIYTTTGQVVQEGVIQSGGNINVGNLPSGTYYFGMNDRDGRPIAPKPFVKL